MLNLRTSPKIAIRRCRWIASRRAPARANRSIAYEATGRAGAVLEESDHLSILDRSADGLRAVGIVRTSGESIATDGTDESHAATDAVGGLGRAGEIIVGVGLHVEDSHVTAAATRVISAISRHGISRVGDDCRERSDRSAARILDIARHGSRAGIGRAYEHGAAIAALDIDRSRRRVISSAQGEVLAGNTVERRRDAISVRGNGAALLGFCFPDEGESVEVFRDQSVHA